MCFAFITRAQTPISLEDAVKEAISNNLYIVIAKNEATLASVSNTWTNAGANPTISSNIAPSISSNNLDQKLASGLDITRRNALFRSINADVAANWNVLNGFKLYTTKEKLNELEQMGEINVSKTINFISSEVANAYVKAQEIKQQIKNQDEQIALIDERITVNQKKFDVGSTGKNDLLQAQIDKNNLVSQSITLKNEYQNALISLCLSMGKSSTLLPEIQDTILVAETLPLSYYKETALRQNPDIQFAKKEITILNLSRKEIDSGRLPNLNLNAAYNFTRSQNEGGFSLFNQNYGPSASLNLFIPIYSGGRIQNQLANYDVQIKNRLLSIKQLELEYCALILQAYNEVDNSLKRIALEKQNLKIAQENYAICLGRAKLQSITSLELREAQFSIMNIQSRIVEYQYQAKISQIKLNVLSGLPVW
jgi:outer membrane protein TolC